ncbi:MAG: glucosaminidase domain-containing protein [Pseudohongiellaceae bacterium]
MAVALLLTVALAGLVVYVQLAAATARAQVAAIEPIIVFPDFANIVDIDVKKQQFFDYLQDYVVAENRRVLALRDEVASLAVLVNSGVGLSSSGERQRFLELAEAYRIDAAELNDRGIAATLMRRVDAIPVSMALAQAANESAWGTSRFALEGFNLFGQWCYEEGCGLVPLRRLEGASHEVEEFKSVEEAVAAYFYNINTHPSYLGLRELREEMRRHGEPLDSMRLVAGLGRYSERGLNYVDEVQTLIEQNGLMTRDRALGDL